MRTCSRGRLPSSAIASIVRWLTEPASNSPDTTRSTTSRSSERVADCRCSKKLAAARSFAGLMPACFSR